MLKSVGEGTRTLEPLGTDFESVAFDHFATPTKKDIQIKLKLI